jgi:hypothetical protein
MLLYELNIIIYFIFVNRKMVKTLCIKNLCYHIFQNLKNEHSIDFCENITRFIATTEKKIITDTIVKNQHMSISLLSVSKILTIFPDVSKIVTDRIYDGELDHFTLYNIDGESIEFRIIENKNMAKSFNINSFYKYIGTDDSATKKYKSLYTRYRSNVNRIMKNTQLISDLNKDDKSCIIEEMNELLCDYLNEYCDDEEFSNKLFDSFFASNNTVCIIPKNDPLILDFRLIKNYCKVNSFDVSINKKFVHIHFNNLVDFKLLPKIKNNKDGYDPLSNISYNYYINNVKELFMLTFK